MRRGRGPFSSLFFGSSFAHTASQTKHSLVRRKLFSLLSQQESNRLLTCVVGGVANDPDSWPLPIRFCRVLWHPFWLRIELVLVRRWRRRNYTLYVLVFDVEKLLVGSLAGAAATAATLLQEARLRFWWLVIDRSIFFGLQKRLRLLDFTYVGPWRARRLKPCWVSEAHHPPRGGELGASGKRKCENKRRGKE